MAAGETRGTRVALEPAQMSDRRRANRFVIPEAARGSFRMMQDVYVERLDAEHVSVLADAPMSPGESLLLELPGGAGARSVISVEVVDTAGLMVGDNQKYRTMLRIVDLAPRGENGTEGAA